MKNILPILLFSLLTISCKAEVPAKVDIPPSSTIATTVSLEETSPDVDIAPHEALVEKSSTVDNKPDLKSENEAKIPSQAISEVKEEVTVEASAPIVSKEQIPVAEEVIVSEEEVIVTNTDATSKNIQVEEVVVEEVIEEAPTKVEKEIIPVAIHDSWNKLLQTYVTSSGKVDYAGLKTQISTLDAYLAKLSTDVPSESDLSAEAKAFWMNAYNAFTVKLILNNYPVGSITDLHGGKPWDQKWIKLGSKTYSLNNIEHDILRPKFKDGRVHFAVNCAAKSCPKLSNKAFTAANSEQLLNSLTKAFVNNTSANTIGQGSVALSKIFDWYGADFGDLIGFLNKYSSTKIAKDAAISFKDYNWTLNSK